MKLSTFLALCGALGIGLLAGGCSNPAYERGLSPLPGYIHNSYRRTDPVKETLTLGYRGLEADVFLQAGELLVGHNRGQLRAERSLRSLYLDPLQDLVGRGVALRADGRPLVLNLEMKEEDPATWEALDSLLAEYPELFTTVVAGVEHRGPVDAVLVGWLPPDEALAKHGIRRVAVQARWRHLPANLAEIPAHRLRLITARYDRLLRWRGEGRPPPDDRVRLHRFVSTAHEVPGRLCRVHGVPVDGRIYRVLLAAGVDLIGTKQPVRSARLLDRATDGARGP